MPTHRHPDQRGDLIIQFRVEFPDRLPVKNVDQLRKLLPDDKDSMEPEFMDEGTPMERIKLVPISESMLRQRSQEDEMNNGGPQAVRCATQWSE